MPSRRPHLVPLLIASLGATVLLGITPLPADTLTLNSGITHEGKLISETPEEVRFEVGRTTKLVRTFKRADIKSLVVTPADELALPPIRALVPTPDRLDAIDYRRMIDGAPKNFVKLFPESKYLDEVETIIATLEEEYAKVDAGGIKLGGAWITKEEIDADPYNHQAALQFSEMKELVAKTELLNALRSFDQLEKTYPDSTSYPAAIELTKKILPEHDQRLAAQLARTTKENKEREVAYGRMTPDARDSAQADFKRKLDPFLKQHAADKAAKKKWLDYHMWDLGSIGDAQQESKQESTRLARLDTQALTQRAADLKAASSLAAEEKFAEAAAKLKATGRIASGSYAEQLKDKIEAGVKEAERIAARDKAAAERAERARAREAAALAAAEAEKAGEDDNATKPIPDPRPAPEEDEPAVASAPDNTGDETGGNSEDDEDPTTFDRTGGEAKDGEGGGFGFLTLLLIILPIMGIVTFLSLRAAKNNQVEDFVPAETEEDDTAE